VSRQAFYPREEILQEILQAGMQTEPDYITFCGDGEPTLCEDLGWLIRRTKDELHLPIAVITNGSLSWSQEVRDDLMAADVVIPSLDAGDRFTFRRINRPHAVVEFSDVLQGITKFRQEYGGALWLEVMLVRGVNDHATALHSLTRVIERIEPDRVYVLAPTRPAAEPWVRAPKKRDLARAQALLGKAVSLGEPESGPFGVQNASDAGEAILGIASRHPLRWDQAVAIGARLQDPDAVMSLVSNGQLVETFYQDMRYLIVPRHRKRTCVTSS
jgi:wyosine [tRNA(Phe)-imidazoG37] synthetase (radical SAM superfamily)